MTHAQSYRILIAEDHELARFGLSMALEEKGGFAVCGEAENGQQAVDLALSTRPDVVLMDLGLPVMDGIAATRLLKEKLPETRVIILTSHKEDDEVFAALSAGADGYCMKEIKIERLCQVIEMVMEGALWLDPAIAKLVVQTLPCNNKPDADTPIGASSRKRYNADLTEREREVLHLIVSGKSNKEIALDLNVTPHTAKAHVCNIIQKLAVDDRTQVAVKALQEGLVEMQRR